MTIMKTRNDQNREIVYNLYEDNIFKNKKDIKFISITAQYYIKVTEKFGHCMELIDYSVNSYHISILKKQLDKAKIIVLSWH